MYCRWLLPLDVAIRGGCITSLVASLPVVIGSQLLLSLSAVVGSQWVTRRNGYVPPLSVPGGTDSGETLYVCTMTSSDGLR